MYFDTIDFPARSAAASARALSARGCLAGLRKAEVCVVGAGYAGLSSALHLAQSGYDTVVLEADEVGAGASGRNGGQVMPGFAADPHDLLAALGMRRASSLWAISLEAIAKTRALAGAGCDIDAKIAIVAANRKGRADLERAVAVRRDAFGDRQICLHDATSLGRAVAVANQHGGAIDARAFALDPRKYLRTLAHRALEAGATIHTASPALRLARANGMWTVETPAGCVRAAHVVLAANIDNGSLAPGADRLAAPVRTFMLETDPSPLVGTALAGVAAGYDTTASLHYFRRTADSRLQFGGGGWPGRIAPPLAETYLRREMARVFPQLARLPVARQWSGLVDVTTDGLPRFARQDGLIRLLGFCGHGIALATLAGQLVADAIDEQSDRLDLFTQLEQKRNWPTAAGRTAQLAIQSFAPSMARFLNLASA
jgi:glycine/D-amino acid oxidase-like deaminating enzyme